MNSRLHSAGDSNYVQPVIFLEHAIVVLADHTDYADIPANERMVAQHSMPLAPSTLVGGGWPVSTLL
jgi:hypothetical protein